MWVSDKWRAAGRVVAVLCISVLFAGVTLARPHPPIDFVQPAEAPVTAPSIAANSPNPFGLTSTTSGASFEKWRRLQAAIRVEARILALCRASPEACPVAASKFLSIVEAARARSGRARIGSVNRAVNLAIRPVSDTVNFGLADLWATPLMTFTAGSGDCEDYAIAKYVALREAGVAAQDLRLLLVRDETMRQDHAVTAARLEGHWLILDNRRMALLSDDQFAGVTPLAAFGDVGEFDGRAIAFAAP